MNGLRKWWQASAEQRRRRLELEVAQLVGNADLQRRGQWMLVSLRLQVVFLLAFAVLLGCLQGLALLLPGLELAALLGVAPGQLLPLLLSLSALFALIGLRQHWRGNRLEALLARAHWRESRLRSMGKPLPRQRPPAAAGSGQGRRADV